MPSPDSTAIGAAIRAMRLDRGITQADLAERAGTSPAPLCWIERGRHTPRAATLCRIAAALGVQPSEILARADAGTPAPPATRAQPDPVEIERRTAQVRASNAARQRPASVCVRIGRREVQAARTAARRAGVSLREWIEGRLAPDADRGAS